MVPPKRGSDGSYSSFSSSSDSSSRSSGRNYVDPWDVENALYVRGKRISFASDPNTYSAASAAVEPPLQPPAELCGCEPLYDGFAPDPVRYLGTYCHLCDAEELELHHKRRPKGSSILSTRGSPPTSLTYRVPTTIDIDSCEECSAASCSPVAPPPPLMLFSSSRKLSAAGLRLDECRDCEDNHGKKLVSFSPAPRRFSVPTQPKLAYVYDAAPNRAKAKTSLPSWSSAREKSAELVYKDSRLSDLNLNKSRWERTRRTSLALPVATGLPQTLVECGCSDHEGPHATLLAPPRHPCRWGMARSGHVAIDYTNAWMSLARRIKPSRT
ncbi:uncharacterized protein LOC132197415 [Neocloeon triangulifer]|uniref:uncharacterized protein LOC132197415 n=1 Tax=Neocloeon triangulifer TaxID=2078957 RepID=UPI00286EBEEA|nr:uncharacterized protein LOC132197415 [Neocloeon triangulifer]